VRKAPCDGRREPVQHLALTFIEIAQLGGERTIHLFSRDLLERPPEAREPVSDRSGRQIPAQASEALVDGSSYRCKPHELRQASFLRGLNEIVHSDAR
jgi:hypothetical protein